MKLIHCENCGTKIQPHERRIGSVPTTWSEPGYDFSGCVLCAPASEDMESARDAAWDRRLDEERV